MDTHFLQHPAGLRIAVTPLPSMESVSVGFWIGVGSRHETPNNQGISHFIEHLLFKGTRHRNARQISESIEGIGGYLNAFTSEEMTCYYASARATHLGLLVEVLWDMMFHSTLPPSEIKRERGVILEEIRMYEDQPSQLVLETLNAQLWKNHPLGQPITGTLESVRLLQRKDFQAHLQRHYHRNNLWITIAGNVHPDSVLRHFRTKSVPARPLTAPLPCPDRLLAVSPAFVQKKVEQTHLAIGFRGFSRHHPRRYAARLLSILLGENMSSRLFQSVREQHGLAYSIQSSIAHFSDTGNFVISAGLENEKIAKALRLILKNLHQISTRPPSTKELSRAREYAAGQLCLGLESTSQVIQWMGESLIGYNQILPPSLWIDRLQQVSAREISSTARELFNPTRMALALVGPTPDSPSLHSILQKAK